MRLCIEMYGFGQLLFTRVDALKQGSMVPMRCAKVQVLQNSIIHVLFDMLKFIAHVTNKDLSQKLRCFDTFDVI